MVYDYKELLDMKNKGIKLDWDTITKEQLSHLFIDEGIINSMIADLYDVDANKVRYKRSKWDISIYSSEYFYKLFKDDNKDIFDMLDKESFDILKNKDNIDWISIALTHYLFRNGPVEDMHADGKLSQDDMKILNKYMVNRIAGLLKLANDNEWLKIRLMLSYFKLFGQDWDKPEYDTEDIEQIYNSNIKALYNE